MGTASQKPHLGTCYMLTHKFRINILILIIFQFSKNCNLNLISKNCECSNYKSGMYAIIIISCFNLVKCRFYGMQTYPSTITKKFPLLASWACIVARTVTMPIFDSDSYPVAIYVFGRREGWILGWIKERRVSW